LLCLQTSKCLTLFKQLWAVSTGVPPVQKVNKGVLLTYLSIKIARDERIDFFNYFFSKSCRLWVFSYSETVILHRKKNQRMTFSEVKFTN
jgi:hypothetical protein